jgi:very-short-patch-repair endonuclease
MPPDFSELKKRARRLRREQTDAESKLWARLRDRQLCNAKFRRQHAIALSSLTFARLNAGWSLNSMADSMQHKSKQIREGLLISNGAVIECFAFEITKC